MRKFASVKMAGGLLELRDLTADDVPAIVDYWVHSPTEFLDAMGVDLARLGSSKQIHERFATAIPTGDFGQSRMAFGIWLNEEFVGYTLLNRYSDEVNYSHWHIVDANLRAKGISTALYPWRLKTFFEVTPISRLIHQTRTSNLGVNRMLDKFVPVAESVYVEKPDGVGIPGDFNHRYVRREDVPKIFARARDLGILTQAEIVEAKLI
jgi:RimJ/RimL family protein N-acetyltransferase